MRLLRPYNPLVYPAGALPGFDPTHPFSFGARFSAVTTGAGVPLSLFQGASPPLVGPNPSFRVDGIMGPVAKYNGATQNNDYSGQTIESVAPQYWNFAAILSVNSTAAINAWFTSKTSAGAFTMRAPAGTSIAFIFQGGSAVTVGTIAINTPYFVALSANNSVTDRFNSVIVNLLTGQTASINSGVITSGNNQPSNGTYRIGNDSSGNFGAVSIASIFFGSSSSPNAWLSAGELLNIAADPWPLWYPPVQRTVMFSGLRQPLSVVGDTLFGSAPLIGM